MQFVMDKAVQGGGVKLHGMSMLFSYISIAIKAIKHAQLLKNRPILPILMG